MPALDSAAAICHATFSAAQHTGHALDILRTPFYSAPNRSVPSSRLPPLSLHAIPPCCRTVAYLNLQQLTTGKRTTEGTEAGPRAGF